MAKTIIVTGASRGIGLAIAKYLLQEGNNVLILARTNAPLEELRSRHAKQVRVMTGDMADLSMGKEAAKFTIAEFGQIDGLILNHGTLSPVTRVSDSEAEDWKQSFDVNFFSCVAFAQAALPAIRKAKGCILLTSSGAAAHSYSAWGAYSASKAALNSFGMTLAVEEPDVTSISIAPGVVDTQMQQDIRNQHSSAMDEKDAARFHSLHKDGELLRPEYPANVMARLVLDPPKKLSGQFLRWNHESLAEFQDT